MFWWSDGMRHTVECLAVTGFVGSYTAFLVPLARSLLGVSAPISLVIAFPAAIACLTGVGWSVDILDHFAPKIADRVGCLIWILAFLFPVAAAVAIRLAR
jgi:hypothetical protein